MIISQNDIFFHSFLCATGIGILGKVYSCGKFGRIVGNWRYTLVMSPTKTAGNGAKKNIPWGYHGMSNFPGGVVRFDGIRYDKYRVFAGNFHLFAASIFARHATVPPLLSKSPQKQQGI